MAYLRALALLFLTTFLFALPPGLDRKPERPRLNLSSNATTAPKTINVDCTKGDKIQDAIDKNAGPMTVNVHGLCVESVSIQAKVVNLHGTDPATDGIQGTSTELAALRIFDIRDRITVENLGIRNGPASGVAVIWSQAQLTNCHITGHTASTGLNLFESHVIANDTTVADNQRGAVVQDSQFFCIACDFTNNVGVAASATRGGLFSLLDSVVTGRHGVQANTDGSYGDIDCISEDTTHPCLMEVTGRAAAAFGGGVAGIYGAGDFKGSVTADDHGSAFLYGSRQILNASLGPPNHAGSFGTLWALQAFETGEESQLYGNTNVNHFGRLMATEATALTGSIQCDSAGDAWLDATVVISPGVTVTGCEHASVP